jgi:hypothetical protein
MRDRPHHGEHCDEHLLPELLERQRNDDAAIPVRENLGSTLHNLVRIADILQEHREP